MASVCNVSEASQSTRLLASTTLRNILGTKTLQVRNHTQEHPGNQNITGQEPYSGTYWEPKHYRSETIYTQEHTGNQNITGQEPYTLRKILGTKTLQVRNHIYSGTSRETLQVRNHTYSGILGTKTLQVRNHIYSGTFGKHYRSGTIHTQEHPGNQNITGQEPYILRNILDEPKQSSSVLDIIRFLQQQRLQGISKFSNKVLA